MSQILKIALNDSLNHHTNRISNIVKNGGVIAFPTDTYYGLGVSPFNEKGILQIFKIKSRDANKPLLVLISSETQLEQLTQSRSQEADRLIKEIWPAPLTLNF